MFASILPTSNNPPVILPASIFVTVTLLAFKVPLLIWLALIFADTTAPAATVPEKLASPFESILNSFESICPFAKLNLEPAITAFVLEFWSKFVDSKFIAFIVPVVILIVTLIVNF